MKEQNIVITLIVGLVVMYACSDMKNSEYGNLIFGTEYDGLVHTDRLWLYDNEVFKIDMPNLEANGRYTIREDTIFLDYFKFKGKNYQAFVIENEFIYELTNDGDKWVRSSRDTAMGVYINKLTGE